MKPNSEEMLNAIEAAFRQTNETIKASHEETKRLQKQVAKLQSDVDNWFKGKGGE